MMNRQALAELMMGVCMVFLVAVVARHMAAAGQTEAQRTGVWETGGQKTGVLQLGTLGTGAGKPGAKEAGTGEKGVQQASTGKTGTQQTGAGENDGHVIVLDAGHGGNDPGKIGVNQANEKDINLQIVLRLKNYLENDGVKVVLTRETDEGLYTAADGNKKQADLRRRCEIIDEAEPDAVVSIHQNSYHEEAINGAQVFYYKTSVQGKLLAELLQKRFDYVLGDMNRRSAKANENYYLLIHTDCPIVIAECGFLSNWQEAERLVDGDYQDKVAWTLYMGIMQYLNTV